MDWTKSKTILIVALLITNLFLVATYQLFPGETAGDEDLLETETIALLEAKNIFIKGELPSKHSNMPVLTVNYDRLDPNLLEELIENQIPLPVNYRNRESNLQMLEDFLKNCGVWSDRVTLSGYESEESRTIVTFQNVHQGFLIEDSYIVCVIENGKVTSMDRYWLEPVAFGRTKLATMSASAALLFLMTEKHEKGAILVEDMQMVYWLDQRDYSGEDTISDTAFPTWKITYNDKQVKHVPAFSE